MPFAYVGQSPIIHQKKLTLNQAGVGAGVSTYSYTHLLRACPLTQVFAAATKFQLPVPGVGDCAIRDDGRLFALACWDGKVGSSDGGVVLAPGRSPLCWAPLLPKSHELTA